MTDIDELLKLAEANGIESEDLDSLVYDISAEIAHSCLSAQPYGWTSND